MGILYLELYTRVTVAKISNIRLISMGIHPLWACLEMKLLCGHGWAGFPLGMMELMGKHGLGGAWCTLECVRRGPLEAVCISQLKKCFLETWNT